MNGLRLKAATGSLSEDDLVQINTLLTLPPGSMYKLPEPAKAAAPASKPARTARRG